MRPRVIEANPCVEETRNQVAIARGPVVYCLESADLSGSKSINEIALERHAPLKPVACSTLPGITAIKTRGVRTAAGDWAGKLYRDVADVRREEIEISLVPYFAWDNRGSGEMTVWMPVVG